MRSCCAADRSMLGRLSDVGGIEPIAHLVRRGRGDPRFQLQRGCANLLRAGGRAVTAAAVWRVAARYGTNPRAGQQRLGLDGPLCAAGPAHRSPVDRRSAHEQRCQRHGADPPARRRAATPRVRRFRTRWRARSSAASATARRSASATRAASRRQPRGCCSCGSMTTMCWTTRASSASISTRSIGASDLRRRG